MKTFKGRAGGDKREGGFRGRPVGAIGGRPPAGPFKKRTFSKSGPSMGASTLHDAVCNACGKACQVPFEPNGRKPVYCRDCFIPKADGADRAPRTFDKNSKRFSDHDRQGRSPYPRPEVRAAAATSSVERQIAELTARVDALTRAIEKLAK